MAEYFLCVTCGTQHAASETPPSRCPICDDERQYVGEGGQRWTTLAELRSAHRNVFTAEEPGLTSLVTEPKFGIGQRAFLIETPAGNLLWDCVSLLDDATQAEITARGGVQAIAISHPHYYSTMVEWSSAFDAPIYLHADDRPWVMRTSDRIRFWQGDVRTLFGGLTLVRTGGHFDGFQVLHWPAGAEGNGVLLAGDQPFVCQDRRWVSFMYSYPNLIPLSAVAIRQITSALAPWRYDRLYGAFAGQCVTTDAHAAVERSAERYLRAIGAM